VSDIAARNRRNKRNGSRWQSEFRDGMRKAGFDIERLALAGKEDEGDAVVRIPLTIDMTEYVVVENKAGALKPAEFVREAVVEADHFAKHRGIPRGQVTGIAVVKARGKNWRDAYVITTVREYFGLGDES